jgi:hypothetical protein
MFLLRPVAGNHESERWERRVGVMIKDWDFHRKEQHKMMVCTEKGVDAESKHFLCSYIPCEAFQA